MTRPDPLYRGHATTPDAHYEVRTPPLYWVVLGVLGVFGIGALAALAARIAGIGMWGTMPWHLVGLLLLIAATPIASWSSAAYRIGRGGAVRFFPTHVEVPAASGAPLHFEREGLVVHATHLRVRYMVGLVPIANVGRGVVLRFSGQGVQRDLSTLTLRDRSQEQALLADLDRFLRGEHATGRPRVVERPVHVSPEGDSYDDRIDRELREMERRER